jgi:hypothetical protein
MDCHCDVVKGMEGFRLNWHRHIQWITRQATLQSFNSHERLKSIEVEGPVTRLALHRGYFKYEFLEKRGHHETCGTPQFQRTCNQVVAYCRRTSGTTAVSYVIIATGQTIMP